MLVTFLRRLSPAVMLLAPLAGFAQPPAPAPPPPMPSAAAPAPSATAVAASVNGQAIPEAAVQRALKRVPPDKHAEARPEIINYLVENLLIDQHLLKAGVAVSDAEVEARIKQIEEELKKVGQTLDQMLIKNDINKEEFRAQVFADMRWDKFCATQGTDAALQGLFTQNPGMFDGSFARARHILLAVPAGDARAVETAKAQLLAFRKQAEDAAAAGLTKLPATADPLAREKERCRLTEEEFARIAKEKSVCPSKEEGGDVNWFPRAGGDIVEPFAAAAFALKPYQMSEPVVTPFGVHLILLTDQKPGKPVKFEDVKGAVMEVYCTRMRDGLIAQLKPAAQIAIAPVKP